MPPAQSTAQARQIAGRYAYRNISDLVWCQLRTEVCGPIGLHEQDQVIKCSFPEEDISPGVFLSQFGAFSGASVKGGTIRRHLDQATVLLLTFLGYERKS